MSSCMKQNISAFIIYSAEHRNETQAHPHPEEEDLHAWITRAQVRARCV